MYTSLRASHVCCWTCVPPTFALRDELGAVLRCRRVGRAPETLVLALVGLVHADTAALARLRHDVKERAQRALH